MLALGNRKQLEDLDYEAIARDRSVPATEEEAYLLVRCHLVLGDYPKAQERLDHFFKLGLLSLRVTLFLKTQLAVYQRLNLSQCALVLCDWASGHTESVYLKAECLFLMGYVHSLMDEYKPASRYYRLAVERYLEAGLTACAAVSQFNLCTTYDHLNCRDLFSVALRDLDSFAKLKPIPSVQVLAWHIQAHDAVNREAYPEAIDLLVQVRTLAIKECRQREVGASTWLLLYLYLKTHNLSAFEKLLSEVKAQGCAMTTEYQVIIHEIERIWKVGLWNLSTARRQLREWKTLGMNRVAYFFLWDLLLEGIERSQDYSALYQLAIRAERDLQESQTSLRILDFRKYEILSLIKLGKPHKAQAVLHAFEKDAEELNSVSRGNFAKKMKGWVTQASSERDAEATFLLDCAAKEAHWKGVRYSLSSFPLVLRLLENLLTHRDDRSLGQVFRSVYRERYLSERHDRRLHSLIDRTRKIFGVPDLIFRSQGQVCLNSKVDWQIRALSSERALGADLRRENLSAAIRGAKRPVSISELEEKFSISRRTLQLDLKVLMREGRVYATGKTRLRTYFGRELC